MPRIAIQSMIESVKKENQIPDEASFQAALASQGITTPEFQTTAETTVIRQANFFYDGLFNPTSSAAVLSAFKNGNNSLAMEFTPWMAVDADGNGLHDLVYVHEGRLRVTGRGS